MTDNEIRELPMTHLRIEVSLVNLQCEFKDGEIAPTTLVFAGKIAAQSLGSIDGDDYLTPLSLVVRQLPASTEPDFSRNAYRSSLTTPEGQLLAIIELPLRVVEFAGVVELLKRDPAQIFVLDALETSSFVWKGVEIAALGACA
jgi:hypothetical protein